MGGELTRENDNEGRWKEYFVQLLNGDEIREIGGHVRSETIGYNERVVEMLREQIIVTLKNIKGGKAVFMDGIVEEMLKNGGISITHWLLKILNRCMESGVVPEDWEAACIVPVYKGKGDIRDCVNYSRISILNSIKGMFVNSLAYVRVKGGESEFFRINRGVRQGCIISLWLFNVYMDAVMKKVKVWMGRRGVLNLIIDLFFTLVFQFAIRFWGVIRTFILRAFIYMD